ncbi:triacylglycerol lipase [Coniophora puteana RWD-64-598 SS2]|uniref:Triacylglycerol lipase n=1 Tax=Coniophora puteana (strain RWD-64-598) TaxID=741705 RepID=A0A5M3MNU3_CONPW|nr:triacylglycerol lipase [Coniophora puteana RWD-64-598 SS2]EIW80839.1 triacylglycerol lipase [Coniophora puteana RWD-64-598 SS2]
MHVPLIGRLSIREYTALIAGFSLLAVETILRFIIFFLPKPVINWFYDRSRFLFHRFAAPRKPTSKEQSTSHAIRMARDFGELCALWEYEYEEHVVLTKDGYLLGLHRLPAKRRQGRGTGTSTGKPVVYLHHGLLMNSEVWVCLTEAERSLPFVLAEQGFDVWLGNNRGNKYSKKSIHHDPNSTQFWNYSIDDFAWHDIPDSIQYILDITRVPSLSYIGFSQGTAQALAALSIHPPLNEKVNVFIALAPAMNPAGLSQPIVDGLMKTSPTLMYLLFGRKAILSSAPSWQAILYPPIFTWVIDASLTTLFNWRSRNIAPEQKLAAYAHLYSFASVKSVVHWFQIMREAAFQMYDDDVSAFVSPHAPGAYRAYRPARFPTKNISTPVVLLYGDADSLVDIDVMLKELPAHTIAKRLRGYEHLDILWGQNVDEDVIPEVLNALGKYADVPEEQEDADVGTGKISMDR